jgi:hypothetical protein
VSTHGLNTQRMSAVQKVWSSYVCATMDVLTDLLKKFREHGSNLMKKVEEALDTKAWESGHVTGSRLKETLEDFQENNVEAVNSRLERMRAELNRAIERKDRNMDLEVLPTRTVRQIQGEQTGGVPLSTFACGGWFYLVPKHFLFPKVRLREAIRFLLKGQTVSLDGQERVRPFMKLTLAMLPRNLNATFRTPLFSSS